MDHLTDPEEEKLRHLAELSEVPMDYFALQLGKVFFVHKALRVLSWIFLAWLGLLLVITTNPILGMGLAILSALQYCWGLSLGLLATGLSSVCALYWVFRGGPALPNVGRGETPGAITVWAAWHHQVIASAAWTRSLSGLVWVSLVSSLVGLVQVLWFWLPRGLLEIFGQNSFHLAAFASCLIALLAVILPAAHAYAFMSLYKASKTPSIAAITSRLELLEKRHAVDKQIAKDATP